VLLTAPAGELDSFDAPGPNLAELLSIEA
jgi:hypothetical protein